MDLGTRDRARPRTGPPRLPSTRSSSTPSEAARLFERIVDNIARVVQGNDEAIRLSVTCLVAGGHLLVEDVPGVGKTSLGKALAASVSCRHRRIQFTSDLLPSDVTGVSVFDVAKTSFEFRPGPIFANIVLGDEINRTPPKTQSALLESMEERQVTVDGITYKLPDPFMVVATQNPHRARGDVPAARQPARPLPAQDPDRLSGRRVRGRRCSRPTASIEPLERAAGRRHARGRAGARRHGPRGVHTSPLIQRYIVQIANATRVHPAVVLGMSPAGGARPAAGGAGPGGARGSRLRRARRREGDGPLRHRAPPRAEGGGRPRAGAPWKRSSTRCCARCRVPDLPAEHR